MSQDNENEFDQGLKSLEQRVEELILLCQQLKDENQTLREQNSILLSEKAHLMKKNELARTRVEAMIMRLKSMEQEYGQ